MALLRCNPGNHNKKVNAHCKLLRPIGAIVVKLFQVHLPMRVNRTTLEYRVWSYSLFLVIERATESATVSNILWQQ